MTEPPPILHSDGERTEIRGPLARAKLKSFVGFVLLLGLALLMLLTGPVWLHWFSALFFIAAAVKFTYLIDILVHRNPTLAIESDELLLHPCTNTIVLPWSAVESIDVKNVGYAPGIAIVLNDPLQATNLKAKSLVMRMLLALDGLQMRILAAALALVRGKSDGLKLLRKCSFQDAMQFNMRVLQCHLLITPRQVDQPVERFVPWLEEVAKKFAPHVNFVHAAGVFTKDRYELAPVTPIGEYDDANVAHPPTAPNLATLAARPSVVGLLRRNIALLFIGVIFGGASLLALIEDERQWWITLGLSCGIVCFLTATIQIYTFLRNLRSRVLLDREGMLLRTAKGAARIYWKDIESISSTAKTTGQKPAITFFTDNHVALLYWSSLRWLLAPSTKKRTLIVQTDKLNVSGELLTAHMQQYLSWSQPARSDVVSVETSEAAADEPAT